jgi:hypothetical protein
MAKIAPPRRGEGRMPSAAISHERFIVRKVTVFLLGLCLAPVGRALADGTPALVLTPSDTASVSSPVEISCTYANPPANPWVDLLVDGQQIFSSPSTPDGSYMAQLTAGTHSVDCQGWRWNDGENAGVMITSTQHLITVISGSTSTSPVSYPSVMPCSAQWGLGYQCATPGVANYQTPAPSASPGTMGVGPTISGITGSAAGIQGADTNPADFGSYNTPGGQGLIGGPLLDDATAASKIVPEAKSTIETGSDGNANEAANNYFELDALADPSSYQSQLDSFWSGANPWDGVSQRIDGACPLENPTTADVAQWAAAKWGINPTLMYAEAVQEGHWDQLSLGDGGTSSGVWQVADRGSGHAFPGFAGAGSNLARENTCFNADFYAGHLYAAFHGWTGECPASDIAAAIQSWFSGQASTGGGQYSSQVLAIVADQGWLAFFPSGMSANTAVASSN